MQAIETKLIPTMKIYTHPDGRRIEIHATCKRRYLPTLGGGRLDPNTRRETTWQPFGGDQWPVLQRATVPNLTDEEWYAKPNDEWKEVEN